MDIDESATTRYTTKAYDTHKHSAIAQLEQIKPLQRFAPSSTNSQPWHFVIVDDGEGKGCIAKAISGSYGANESKVLNASHVVVLCARIKLDDLHLGTLLSGAAALEIDATPNRGF
jgi:nitroreductase/dihydropteridine reductase